MIKKYYLNQGFTLIEISLTMGLMSIIFGLAYLLTYNFKKEQAYTVNSFFTVDTANKTIQTIMQEVRNARNSENGAYPLEITQNQELAFYTDLNDDGDNERVHYYLDGQTLKKSIIKPSGFPVVYNAQDEQILTVAENVINGSEAIFTYYNGNYPVDITNNPLSVNQRLAGTRLIGIKIIVNSNPKELKNNYEVSGFAQIRMLKDNL